MYGRYGIDELYRFNMYVVFGLLILQYIFKIRAFYYIELLLLAVNVFRSLSKNHTARLKENRRFILIRNKVTSFFKLQWARITNIRVYRYKKCPHCGQTLRLPKQKGKHTVTCPKCHQDFDVRIR